MKKDFLYLVRSPAELAAFADIRQAFDPHAVLNPNVLIPTTKAIPVSAWTDVSDLLPL